MSTPALIVLFWAGFVLVASAVFDSDPIPRPVTHYSFRRCFFNTAAWLALLWWGGFFNASH